MIDEVERLAISRAKELFGAEHANVQPYSGRRPTSPSTWPSWSRATPSWACRCPRGAPHPRLAGLGDGDLVQRGPLRSRPGQRPGRHGRGARAGAVAHRPKLLFCGGTAVPRTIDFAGFAEIAGEVDALMVADVSHFAGLIAGGAHPSPVPHADVVTTTTHKTLRGPRGHAALPRGARDSDRQGGLPRPPGRPAPAPTAAIAATLGRPGPGVSATTPGSRRQCARRSRRR